MSCSTMTTEKSAVSPHDEVQSRSDKWQSLSELALPELSDRALHQRGNSCSKRAEGGTPSREWKREWQKPGDKQVLQQPVDDGEEKMELKLQLKWTGTAG